MPRCPASSINIWQQEACPEQQCEKLKMVAKKEAKKEKEKEEGLEEEEEEGVKGHGQSGVL